MESQNIQRVMTKNFPELKKGVCILNLKSTHQILRINKNRSTYCGKTAEDQGLKWKLKARDKY